MQFLDLSLSISPVPPQQPQQQQQQQQKPQQDDQWTKYQKKCFRKGLIEFSTDTPNFLEKVASRVPEKSLEQVKLYFETCYKLEGNVHVLVDNVDNDCILPSALPSKNFANNRKKPLIWTKKEHENFLLGVNMYRKGFLKQMAENCLHNITATQTSQNLIIKTEKNRDHANESTITAAAVSITNNNLAASSSSKRKVIGEDDNEDDDVIILDFIPDLPPRKVQRTLNLFPLVSTFDYASSSGEQDAKEAKEAKEVQEHEELEYRTLNLFPSYPLNI